MKQAVAKRDVETLPTLSGDEAVVAALGRQVLDFMKGLVDFLKTANSIELSAKDKLTTAQTLRVPTTSAEDEHVQRFVLACADDIKNAETHWTITSAVSRFHKLLTGARSRAVDPLTEARRIGNNLHNEYTTRARREAEEADRRRREQAEREAQERRDRELAAAEDAALKREATSKELSEREQRFVDQWFAGDISPAQCARIAGYKNPAEAGERLIKSPKIIAAVEAKREAAVIRQQAAARARQPLDVQHTEVRPDITRATGAKDRTTKSAELLDENALIAAVLQGGYGIPWDILTVKPAKLNEYARSMGSLINKWPGVRYKEDTGVTR